MQESGLIEVIPLTCFLTIKDQYFIFLHPESLRVNPVEGCVCVCVCVWLQWFMVYWLQHPLFTDMAGDVPCIHTAITKYPDWVV